MDLYYHSGCIGNAAATRPPEQAVLVHEHVTIERTDHCVVCVWNNGMDEAEIYGRPVLPEKTKADRTAFSPGPATPILAATAVFEKYDTTEPPLAGLDRNIRSDLKAVEFIRGNPAPVVNVNTSRAFSGGEY